MKLPHAIPRTLFSAGMAVVAGTTLVGVANAATQLSPSSVAPSAFHQGMRAGKGGFGTGIFGTVQSVNGTTIIVAGKDGTTYTVDASAATVTAFDAGTKRMTESTPGSIAAGDMVAVMGTVSGTSVTASRIMDGMPPAGMGMAMRGSFDPAITGTVSAISGTTITLTGRNGGTFTVNAASTTIRSFSAGGNAPAAASLSDIAIGDTISVRGPITEASLTADRLTIGTPSRGNGATPPAGR
ncbi:MAG TPA: DUF5666 domain-containing protein [Candidatus Paceibacterota bacterium]|nr:DUF5666 domain-containing protein [Candidatus Paceibacterota bacterium]